MRPAATANGCSSWPTSTAISKPACSSPLDDAILEHASIDVDGWRKIDEVPFDFERRRVSVLLDDGGSRLLVVKGAPEDILRLSASYEDDEGAASQPARRAPRARASSAVRRARPRRLPRARHRLAPGRRRTIRTRWSATRPNWSSPALPPSSIRPRKARAPRWPRSRADHVAVKVITGDNELVTEHICAAARPAGHARADRARRSRR